MSETKTQKMVLPVPRRADGKDNKDQLRQQAASGTPMQAKMSGLQISCASMEAMDAIVEMDITPEVRAQLEVALSNIVKSMHENLQKVDLPVGVSGGPERGTFAPYMITTALAILSQTLAVMQEDATVPDRAAFAAELVRNWAALVIAEELEEAGVKPEQGHNVTALSVINQPAPISVCSAALNARKEIHAEAKAKGITPDQLIRDKLTDLGIDLEKMDKGRVRGEPEPDDSGIMF